MSIRNGVRNTRITVQRTLMEVVEIWKWKEPEICGVVSKTSIFATNTWFVMVTLKHTQLCGMFTAAVTLVISMKTWTTKVQSIKNGGNLTVI